uniref:Uncharacterized protein n=1 Tax=Ditylum brightwellii TaxID=49249 RepID=A0A7S4RH03_9STRA|eukprot:4059641-Ditylum_brightwellii.AAC.1
MALAQASTNPDKEKVIEALKRDQSYWSTSLLKEVADLKLKLECKETKERNVRSKATDLEARLQEVTTSSNAAAASFRELTKELQVENADLEEEIKDLKAKKSESDRKIERLEKQNKELKGSIEDFEKRLEAISGLFRAMEDQRLIILRATGDWEDTLQKASDLVEEREAVEAVLLKDFH